MSDLLSKLDLAGADPSGGDASPTSPPPTPPAPPAPPAPSAPPAPPTPPSSAGGSAWERLPELAWESVLEHTNSRSGPSLVAAARGVCRQWRSVLEARFATIPQLSCVPSAGGRAVLKERPFLTRTASGAAQLHLNRQAATLGTLKVRKSALPRYLAPRTHARARSRTSPGHIFRSGPHFYRFLKNISDDVLFYSVQMLILLSRQSLRRLTVSRMTLTPRLVDWLVAEGPVTSLEMLDLSFTEVTFGKKPSL